MPIPVALTVSLSLRMKRGCKISCREQERCPDGSHIPSAHYFPVFITILLGLLKNTGLLPGDD